LTLQVLIEDNLDLIYNEFKPLLTDLEDPQREANLKRLYALVTMLNRPVHLNEMVHHYEVNIISIGRAEIQNCMDAIERKGVSMNLTKELIQFDQILMYKINITYHRVRECSSMQLRKYLMTTNDLLRKSFSKKRHLAMLYTGP